MFMKAGKFWRAKLTKKNGHKETFLFFSSLKRNFLWGQKEIFDFRVVLLVIISLVLPSSITMCLICFSYDFKRLKMKCVSAGCFFCFLIQQYYNVLFVCLGQIWVVVQLVSDLLHYGFKYPGKNVFFVCWLHNYECMWTVGEIGM